MERSIEAEDLILFTEKYDILMSQKHKTKHSKLFFLEFSAALSELIPGSGQVIVVVVDLDIRY